MTTVAVRLRIEGRVQGVWFRGWTSEKARELALDGWVRNRTDGSVEALFRGSAEDVERMVALCREGPRAAVVTSIERLPAPAEEHETTGFVSRPTV